MRIVPLKRSESIRILLVLMLTLSPSSRTASLAGTPSLGVAVTLRATGLMAGDPDGSLRWDEPVTRAEAARMLVLGMTVGRDEGPRGDSLAFTDLSPTHWAASYLVTAAERGLLRGYPDGTCRPDVAVSRRELAVMLSRVWTRLGGVHQDQPPLGASGENWALEEIERASGVSDLLILAGKSQEDVVADRRETAEMVFGVLNRAGALFHLRGEIVHAEGDAIVLRLGTHDRAFQVQGVVVYDDQSISLSRIPAGSSGSIILDSTGRCAVVLVE